MVSPNARYMALARYLDMPKEPRGFTFFYYSIEQLAYHFLNYKKPWAKPKDTMPHPFQKKTHPNLLKYHRKKNSLLQAVISLLLILLLILTFAIAL